MATLDFSHVQLSSLPASAGTLQRNTQKPPDGSRPQSTAWAALRPGRAPQTDDSHLCHFLFISSFTSVSAHLKSFHVLFKFKIDTL